MKIVGILTEFNPFHSGHAYLLHQVREKVGPEAGIVCVMSGNFVQRGEAALLEKHVRAEAALRCGADVVLELPVACALSSAEGFARGGVYLMQQSGCITHLAFGSECGDISALERVAACLDSEAYRAGLRRFLDEGMSFAACRQAVVRGILGNEDAALLDGANNNLGVEYLKAVRQLGWTCEACTVSRRGAGHDSLAAGEYRSATALRGMLQKEEWAEAAPFLPAEVMALYQDAFAAGSAPVSLALAERDILARLRTLEKEDFAQLPDCAEGLHHRMYRAARQAATVTEFLMQVKTKRYALSRLRRMVLCAWLDIDRAAAAELPQYLRPLGCTVRGRNILAQMRKTAQLPVLVKGAEVRKLSAAAQRQFLREAHATERYALLYPDLAQAVPGQEWRMGPVILRDGEEGRC